MPEEETIGVYHWIDVKSVAEAHARAAKITEKWPYRGYENYGRKTLGGWLVFQRDADVTPDRGNVFHRPPPKE